jgi:hypothetical protein
MTETGATPVRRGRPKWIPPDLKEVERLGALGLNYRQIADALGIHRDTLIQKRKYSSDFSDAIRRGKARANTAVANTAYQLATSGECPQMTQFWLKSQAGWREVNEFEVNDNDGMQDKQQADRDEQLRLLRAMTEEELADLKLHKQAIAQIIERVQQRLADKKQPAIETTTQPL